MHDPKMLLTELNTHSITGGAVIVRIDPVYAMSLNCGDIVRIKPPDGEAENLSVVGTLGQPQSGTMLLILATFPGGKTQ